MVVVRTPLVAQAANITTSTAPTIGQINIYDATSGSLTPPLPALSGLNVHASMIVQKYLGDTTANTVTFTCAGSDTFDNATTTRVLKLSGELEELQVISVSGTKKWKVVSDGKTLGSLDGRYVTSSTTVASGTGNPTVTRQVADPNRTASKWREAYISGLFNSNPDPAMFWGWNADRATTGGGDSAEPAWLVGLEADYWESPTSRVMEWYTELIRVDGSTLRPIMVNVSRDPAKNFARAAFYLGNDAANTSFSINMNMTGSNQVLFSVDPTNILAYRPLALQAPTTTNATNGLWIHSNGTGTAYVAFNNAWEWSHDPSSGRINLTDDTNSRVHVVFIPGTTANNASIEFNCTPWFLNSQVTTASAGSAAALPATPQGYFQFLDAAGTLRKVPYYV